MVSEVWARHLVDEPPLRQSVNDIFIDFFAGFHCRKEGSSLNDFHQYRDVIICPQMTLETAKKLAGQKAAGFIENGQIVGLGTGSTAVHFIDALIERCRGGLKIRAVPSSRHSADRAQAGGIEILDINSAPRIDITVDGADEIDPKKRMIKGRGGAHVREKILASS